MSLENQTPNDRRILGIPVEGGVPVVNDIIRFNANGQWELIPDQTGDVTGAANLGAGEGIFASEIATILNFKSLVVSADLILSSDGNEITTALSVAFLARMTTIESDITTNTTDIATNAAGITTNATAIAARQLTSEKGAANGYPSLDGATLIPIAQIPLITTAKITDLAVTEAKIAALAVTAGKIGALAVIEAKIGALAVTEAKIAAFAVSLAKMKTEVGNANLNIEYNGSGVVVAAAAGGGGSWEVIEDFDSGSALATKTFSFTAIDFETVSELILVIDGSPTANLDLELKINTEVINYDTMGREINASAVETLIGTISATQWKLTNGMSTNDRFSGEIKIRLSKAASTSYPQLQSTLTHSNRQIVLGGRLSRDTASITSIIVTTSTSTWKTGTRMTLYKVNR